MQGVHSAAAAAFGATLMLYLRTERLATDLSTLLLLSRPLIAMREVAEQLQRALAAAVASRS
jgi:hypothetical protein